MIPQQTAPHQFVCPLRPAALAAARDSRPCGPLATRREKLPPHHLVREWMAHFIQPRLYSLEGVRDAEHVITP